MFGLNYINIGDFNGNFEEYIETNYKEMKSKHMKEFFATQRKKFRDILDLNIDREVID